MSQVDIFRIIDITSGPSAVRPSPERGADNHEQQRTSVVPPGLATVAHHPGSRPMLTLAHVELPQVLDPRLVVLREPESARARGYRLLRHRLLSLDNPRVVAVTSAVAGEGATTCALNLSLAMVEDTLCSVLLVEANLSHPAIGKLFGFQPHHSIVEGITQSEQGGPPYSVTSIGRTRLHVAALRDPLPKARLDRILLAAALDDLKRVYDYIVIDAPPVLKSADIDVIGECSDGVIMVTRAGTSKKALVRRAVDQLAPARVLGNVLLDS